MFRRVLQAEFLKLRRTAAFRIAWLSPSAVLALILFIASQLPHTSLRRAGPANDWVALAHVTFHFWGLLMLPLYITVQSSLVAGIDHADNQWKAILARPVPRFTLYLAKLIVVSSLTAGSTLLLVAGIAVTGATLPYLQSVAKFQNPIPAALIVREALQMSSLAFLALTLQHWISLRWRSFSASTGAGIVAMVIGYGMVIAGGQNGAWPAYFPWSLPMLVLATWPVDIPAVLFVSTLVGCLVTALGCVEFSSREIK